MRRPTSQDFISSLPWELKIEWQGKSGVYIMDDDRRATIELSVRGTHDTYSGVIVTITSKTGGKIQNKWFGFDEYLHDRADTRTDYPHGGNAQFMVLSYCGWQWYIAIPKHPELFTKAVERWIAAWV